jgi:hypothetical protein
LSSIKNFLESTPGRFKKLDIPKTDAMSPGHKASTGDKRTSQKLSNGRFLSVENWPKANF